MSARFNLRSAANGWRPVPWRIAAPAVAMALALLAQGCAEAPPRVFSAEPSNPNVRVPPAAYRPVLGGYAGARPVEPAPWIRPDSGAAPAPKDGR